ncbi:hypothetical protein CDAR_185161 [Caerostris darwini]|uniref:Uncharacterized protein n=1 Tax=Caerostris darwini TaxID=1538125 RepID=A0AAV4SS04_9ARAC|nr:hypothetical protein CDAR_185161 [Caerostris darwini]
MVQLIPVWKAFSVILSAAPPLSLLFHRLNAYLQAHHSYTIACSSHAVYCLTCKRGKLFFHSQGFRSEHHGNMGKGEKRRRTQQQTISRAVEGRAPGRRLDNRFGRGHYRGDLGADRWSAVNDPFHQGSLGILIAFIGGLHLLFISRPLRFCFVSPSLGRWSVPRKRRTDGQGRPEFEIKMIPPETLDGKGDITGLGISLPLESEGPRIS